MARHFRPCPDAHALGLLDPSFDAERLHRRLAVVPHAFLKRPAQLGLVGFAHEVVALVVERGIQEETVVLELEVLFGLAYTALAQGDELLAFGEGADGDRPFLKSNWHFGMT